MTSINLGEEQHDALKMALSSKVMVLTGGPGVGKTTIISGLLRILDEKSIECRLCAPTGRAAKRMSEATGREASTIHRLLEFNPFEGGFSRSRENPLTCDLVVVDESSMVDIELMESLLAAIPDAAALLLVGDVDQLPSVGPGRVLGDVIESGAVPVARLNEVFRQAGGSEILQFAHRVNRGESFNPQIRHPDGDLYFAETREQAQSAELVVRLVEDRIPQRFALDPMRDVQVLSPMHNGDAGVDRLNQRLQAKLNASGAGVRRGEQVLRVGDRVMQLRNDYGREVYNGDIGFVRDVSPRDLSVVVTFDGRDVTYPGDEIDALKLAYAATIHKSQGSEYPAVVVVLHKAHYIMLRRNLLYTAVTRGKELVVLVGESAAVQMAIRNAQGEVRFTKLREWL